MTNEKVYRVLDTEDNRGAVGVIYRTCGAGIGETFTGTPSEPDCDGDVFVNGMLLSRFEEVKPEVQSVTAVPEVSITRKRLTIDKIGVGQTFIIRGQPETVYVKISNSHVFNHKRLQMHTTVAERFKQHLNLVAVELAVYNGE